MPTPDFETYDYDVIIIGAGGSGLRAAIEAKERGLRVALVCKSLLGKAHTVMAEGGMAAAMGHVWPEDNWQVHFRDTMRGGKMLNNWRMAQIHAMEAPDRVYELERWGALFDRTKDGRITQRDFGGHRYARLAHVGDRTGLELIRTLQQKVVSMGTDVFMETKILRLLARRRGPDLGRRGLQAPDRRDGPLHRQGLRARHRLHRQVVEVHVELVGVGRRRSRHGHLGRGRRHRHGVRAVPPDRHGVAALGARHPRDRGRARRRRRAAQLRGQALHVRLRGPHVPGRDGGDRRGSRRLVRRPHQLPAHARPPPPRRGGPRHQLRGQGRPRHPARRRLPRHRVAPHARVHPAPAPVDVPPVHGTGRRRHHGGADGGRADLPLHDGRGARRRRDAGRHRPRPVRHRRGVGRHARRQPPGRQLALRPHRLRPPGRHRCVRLRGGPHRHAERRRGGGHLGHRRGLRPLRA